MAKILNLIIQDWNEPTDRANNFAESFEIIGDVQEPEKALRAAVREFIDSGTAEAKQALEYACGCFNWGDAISSVPDSLFEKHGLRKLHCEALDVFVDHDEILCD